MERTTNVYTLLDWFARFSQSLANYAKGGILLPFYEDGSIIDPSPMAIFGESFNDPPETWQTGYDPSRPFGWGNESVMSSTRVQYYKDHQNNAFFYLSGGGKNSFWIPSGCMWKKSCPSDVE